MTNSVIFNGDVTVNGEMRVITINNNLPSLSLDIGHLVNLVEGANIDQEIKNDYKSAIDSIVQSQDESALIKAWTKIREFSVLLGKELIVSGLTNAAFVAGKKFLGSGI